VPSVGWVLAIARTFALVGVEAEPIHVELHVTSGLPSFAIVGLPGAAVRESRERVRSALVNSGFDFPQRRITANLAPADLPKAGPGFDLAIAAALLVATNQLPNGVLERHALAGELALDGSIRPVAGALAMAEGTKALGFRGIAIAGGSAPEAALVEGITVTPLEHTADLRRLAEGALRPMEARARSDHALGDHEEEGDLAELRGQPGLRKALEVAAAGGHSMLLVGPPGCGKTLAARRLPTLLPSLGREELLEVVRIAGASGEVALNGNGGSRPFRAPHHTASARALIGGGSPPRPGEVTRAHRGVLFLDELGEFRRDALEALRQPLEEGNVTLARGGRSVRLPCRFQLVAASNPCPCGHGPDSGECNCPPSVVSRYRAKLSGALGDRIDVFLSLDRPSADSLAAGPGEGSSAIRTRVQAARRMQEGRLGPGRCNAEMTPLELRRHARLTGDAERALRIGHDRLGLSGRGWDRVLRVARTVADLAGSPEVREENVEQALQLRRPADP
jgi:magnesium chelatase family protein